MRSIPDFIPPSLERRARTASVVLALGGVLALSGCETTQTASGSDRAAGGDLAAAAETPGDYVPITDIEDDGLRAERVSDQAERDLDHLLALRRQGKTARSLAAAGTNPADPEPTAAASPAVVWNDRGAGGAKADAAATARTVSQPALAIADEVKVTGSADTRTPPLTPSPAPPPADAASDERLDMLLVDIRRALNMRMAYSDQPLRELIAIAMQSVIDPEFELNPDVFPGITDDERELLRPLQTFFSQLGRELDGSVEAREALERAVAELQSSLVVEPELELPTVALCWRVRGFGDYQVFDRSSFLAHTEQRVILYIEIDRFTSEQNKKRQWVTEVSQQLEIYADADGIPVWTEEWHKAVDVSNNERRDFFTTQVITLPRALSVGRYHLKIRVRDEKSGALAEASIPFEMVADPKLAARME